MAGFRAAVAGNFRKRRQPNGGNVAAGTVPGTPDSTYRLQLTREFGFAEAADAADYLADLGVSHVYLSPVLEAVPGSRHGYDVTDHARIRAELGGEDAFRAMAKRLRALGLGIVLDIVPNHMAVPANLPLNRQLWSVLRDGRSSPYAHWFDIDWAAQDDRMLLPILGGPLGVLPRRPLGRAARRSGRRARARYFDHVLPLWPGTARLPMRGLLESQHYRLAWWRDAAAELNWRRFFDIATLIGIRVEDPAVFDATHEVIVGLVAEGLVDGLRVDHPDGLADPRGYLRRLAAATDGAWVVAEKILEADETLPVRLGLRRNDRVRRAQVIDGLFLDPGGGDALTAEYARFCRQPGDDSLGHAVRRRRRGGQAGGRHRDAGRRGGPAGPAARRHLPRRDRRRRARGADRGARRVPRLPRLRAPGRAPVGGGGGGGQGGGRGARGSCRAGCAGWPPTSARAALGRARPVSGAAGRAGELVVRFQQTTGPVLAKGVEDTAFYRWSRLLALNEVGGDPDRFGVTPAGVPRGGGAAGGRLAGHHDHAVHPRHQAAGGRQGQARRARRAAGAVGRAGRRVA